MEKISKYLYALDLSLDCTGLTIFDLDTFEPVMITSYPMKKIGTGEQKHGEKLYMLTRHLREANAKYPASVLAIEQGFSMHNKATQALFKVHGVVNCLFWQVPYFYYTPMTVKATIWHGKAEKDTIREKIVEKYPDVVFKNNDESDSFAVGLTYMIKECGMNWNKIETVSDKLEKKKKPKDK